MCLAIHVFVVLFSSAELRRWGMGERFVPLVTAETISLSYSFSAESKLASDWNVLHVAEVF